LESTAEASVFEPGFIPESRLSNKIYPAYHSGGGSIRALTMKMECLLAKAFFQAVNYPR